MLVNIPEEYLKHNEQNLKGFQYISTGIFTGCGRWNPPTNRHFKREILEPRKRLSDDGYVYTEQSARLNYGMVDRLSQIEEYYPELLTSDRQFHLYVEKVWSRTDPNVRMYDDWPEYNYQYRKCPKYFGVVPIESPKIEDSAVKDLWWFVIYETIPKTELELKLEQDT